MIALRVFRHINVLKIAVDVGFVVGITAATRPMGSAIFRMPKAASSSITPQVFVDCGRCCRCTRPRSGS